MIVLIVAVTCITVIWLGAGSGEAWTETLAKVGSTIGILLIFPVVYVWKLSRFGHWAERHTSMLLMFFGALVAISGVGITAIAFYQSSAPQGASRSPLVSFKVNPEITWSFESPDPNLSLLGARGSGNSSLFYSFQAEGNNNTDKPIIGISGSIQSDQTLREVLVEFDFSGADGIPKRGKFRVVAFFSPKKEGLSFDEFAKQWSSFTFNYTYNGHSFSVPIGRTVTRKIVERVIFSGTYFEDN